MENYELLFRGGGFATITPCEGGKVHGLLWSLTPECERSLDMYEGYPRFYDKRTVTVRDGLGRELSVMAYIMDERFREPTLPSTAYYNGILKGYRQNGFPVTALKKRGITLCGKSIRRRSASTPVSLAEPSLRNGGAVMSGKIMIRQNM